jgi:hypothetical protein
VAERAQHIRFLQVSPTLLIGTGMNRAAGAGGSERRSKYQIGFWAQPSIRRQNQAESMPVVM